MQFIRSLQCRLVLVFVICVKKSQNQPPHIVYIMADDLGWNDVGFHGSGQIPTPNIDALAYSGLMLHNYYVNSLSTPSRSALMSGKYPIHTGLQYAQLCGDHRMGLPLEEKILPQYLQELGYVNHIIGKWHLGSWKQEYTPTFRGFHSHLGFWTSHHDYFDHTADEESTWGLDMRMNMSVAYDLHGKYSTDLFTEESVKLINAHNPSTPLFLYLAHAAVHSGNPYNLLPAPYEEVEKFKYIKDLKRRRFAAMLSKLDHSVGEVVTALKNKGLLKNSIIVFSTDNGGPANGFNGNVASNYPLRGLKHNSWEGFEDINDNDKILTSKRARMDGSYVKGSIRGTAFLWSPLIKKSSRVANQFMQIVDWLPTLLEAASGKPPNIQNLDGISIWKSLLEDEPSPRTEVLHNINNIVGYASMTAGKWKYIQGTTYGGNYDEWYGPSGREYAYNISLVKTCQANIALESLQISANEETMKSLRKQSTIQCGNVSYIPCNPRMSPCLFDISTDPCEKHNLANTHEDILKELQDKILKYNSTEVPAQNPPRDPRGDPKHFNYVYTNFGDYE